MEPIKQIGNFISGEAIRLFTGAGVSWAPPSSLPLGAELVDMLLGKIIPEEVRQSAGFSVLRPEVVMQVLHDCFGNRLFDAVRPLAEAPPNRLHYLLAKLYERRIVQGIITTNLDLCHERAQTDSSSENILHLHGVAGQTRTVIYALNQVASRHSRQVSSLLRPLAYRCTLIFLGYSARDDFDIAPALRGLPGECKFLWVDHDPKDSS